MSDGPRTDRSSEAGEPPLTLPESPYGPLLRLGASFALTVAGVILLRLYLAFTLSIALFVAAVGLVFRLATQHPAHRMRIIATIAIAVALLGTVGYVLLLVHYFRASTETGFDAVLASSGFLLGLFAIWAIGSRVRRDRGGRRR